MSCIVPEAGTTEDYINALASTDYVNESSLIKLST
jgi:hypothetical protein